jgi:hypothetical protein
MGVEGAVAGLRNQRELDFQNHGAEPGFRMGRRLFWSSQPKTGKLPKWVVAFQEDADHSWPDQQLQIGMKR